MAWVLELPAVQLANQEIELEEVLDLQQFGFAHASPLLGSTYHLQIPPVPSRLAPESVLRALGTLETFRTAA